MQTLLKIVKISSEITHYPVIGTGTGRLHTLRKQQNPAFPVRHYIPSILLASFVSAIKSQRVTCCLTFAI